MNDTNQSMHLDEQMQSAVKAFAAAQEGLQGNEHVQERKVLSIPPEDVADNFTTGLLSSSTAFSIDPVVQIFDSAHTVLAAYYLGRSFTGHKGFVHGGVLATMFDECCGRACVTYFEAQKPQDEVNKGKSGAVTAQLSISYTAPVPTSSIVLVKAFIDTATSAGRKGTAKAQLWTTTENGQQKVLAAEATALFIEPKKPSN